MEYWVKRNTETQANLYSKSQKEIDKQLIKNYRKAMKDIIKDFETLYDKLLLSKEKPLVSDLYKLDKYWKIQAELQNKLEKLGDKEVKILSKNFTNSYVDFYSSLIIPNNDFVDVDIAVAEQIINQIWCSDGKTWEDRVWGNVDKLRQTLNDNLIQCVVSGKKTTELKKILQHDFNVSYNRANTLVRTELAHIQTQSAKDRYSNYGIEKYKILADQTERTCKLCKSMDGKEFYINEMVIGKNAPPFHPNDRCAIIPIVK